MKVIQMYRRGIPLPVRRQCPPLLGLRLQMWLCACMFFLTCTCLSGHGCVYLYALFAISTLPDLSGLETNMINGTLSVRTNVLMCIPHVNEIVLGGFMDSFTYVYLS